MRISAYLFPLFLSLALFSLAGCGGAKKNRLAEARACIESGEYEAAVSLLDESLASGPDAEALWLRAKAREALGDPQAAAADLERAAALVAEAAKEDPAAADRPFLDDLYARLFRLRCPFDRSEFSARGYSPPDLSFGPQDAQRLGTFLTAYERIRPNDARPKLLLGKCCLLGGYYAQAYNYFSACLRLAGEDPWVYKWRGDAARRLMDSGDARLAGRMRNRALDNYNRAIELDGRTPAFYYARGVYYEYTGRPDKALEDFKRALRLDPRFAPAHFDAALVLRNTGRVEQALEHLSSCIEADPDFPDAYFQRAYIYFAYNRRLKDVPSFRRACELARADLEKLLSLMPYSYDGWCLYGDVLRWSNDLEAAARAFRKALECNPRGHNAWYRLGDVYGLMGKWDECYAALTRAIECCDDLDPQYYLYWFTRGKYRQIAARSFAGEGEIERAAELHKQAVADFEQTWRNYKRLVFHQAAREGRNPVTLTADEAENLRCILSLWTASCRALGDEKKLKELLSLMGNYRRGAVLRD